MPAYWVARSRIVDPLAYKKYTDQVPAIIAKHGGKVLARGGRFQIMEVRTSSIALSSSSFRRSSRASLVSIRPNTTTPASSAGEAPAKSKPSWSTAATR